jgi:anti-sigma B factor antagonist
VRAPGIVAWRAEPTIIEIAVAKGGSTLLTIEERRVGDVTILELRGQLVLYEGELTFRTTVDRLSQEGQRKIVVDLRNVDYIDSAGVGILVGKYLSMRRQDGDVKLLHPSPRTLRVMGIAHLLTVFETFETEDAAVRSFEQGTKAKGH